jgi:hypothetical protein
MRRVLLDVDNTSGKGFMETRLRFGDAPIAAVGLRHITSIRSLGIKTRG